MAAKTDSSSSNMVSTRTATCGLTATISRVASMPLTPGIRRSMTTTSGWWASAAVTAAAPSPTSATTSMSGCEDSDWRSPSRNIGWSSATTTRTGSMSALAQGQAALDPGAAASGGRDRQRAAKLGRPLPHGCQTDPEMAVRGHPAAVISHLHLQTFGAQDPQQAVPGPGVADYVGQRFGGNPVGGHLHRRRETVQIPAHLKLDGEPGPVAWRGGGSRQLLGLLPQGGGQSQLVQRWRPQVVDQATDVDHAVADLLTYFGQRVGDRAGAGQATGAVQPKPDRRECGT